MAIYAKTPNGWEAIAQDAKAVSSFGSIVPDGNQTDEGTHTDADGREWVWYEWTDPDKASSFTTDGGLLWVLCVGGGDGGGGNGTQHYEHGQPGLVREGYWEFGAGTRPVTVGARGGNNNAVWGKPSFIDDVLTGFSTQGTSTWGDTSTGRGVEAAGGTGYRSRITGDEKEYGNGYNKPERPGRSGYRSDEQRDGCVIIATVVNGGKPKPVQPALTPATVVAKPVSITGPAVQEWPVRDKQNKRKIVYFLPGNTGTVRSLALAGDGAEALAARRDVLDAIATTEVPEDFEGDPATLLPKKLRGELTGFVEVRATSQPSAVYSVTLGAGVLPGVMVGSGGHGGGSRANPTYYVGGGGSGGVIGQGAHVPVILPVQGTATYTVTVGSTTADANYAEKHLDSQSTTIAVQGQAPFLSAMGGGGGSGMYGGTERSPASMGGSGGGALSMAPSSANDSGQAVGAVGLPGQGHQGGYGAEDGYAGGGGGYSGRPSGKQRNGGAGFDLATALNLNANDGITGQFLTLVSVDGWIAGGGAATAGTATAGGGVPKGDAKDFTGSGGGTFDSNPGGQGGTGGAGAVYIITDA